MDILLTLSVRYRSGDHSDLHRLGVVLLSAEKHWRGRGSFHIITPDDDEVRAEVARLSLDVPVVVHTDEAVLPGVPDALHPWWKQQLLKLAAAKTTVASDFYLVLDADCFFTRETSDSDLVLDGRGRYSYGTGNGYSKKSWYRGCAKLGLPTPERFVNTTPFVFNTRLAQDAFAFVQKAPESIGILGWSEYTLYHSLAVRNGLWDAHHVEAKPLIDNAVWTPQELLTWDASACEGPLCLVQSSVGVFPQEVLTLM